MPALAIGVANEHRHEHEEPSRESLAVGIKVGKGTFEIAECGHRVLRNSWFNVRLLSPVTGGPSVGNSLLPNAL